ncbi:lipoprotein [Brucella oryzae]|uniref:LPS translocon maturation chaperone LptM n=1 Tax=Brucella/Ochrobactrum group TaxID=2826938 RepID=UPI00111D6660|nr:MULTISPECIES: lipoprotein [Brucella/Ochrobactrum group]MBR7652178.1 lipoprotein [Brucella oryzae]
MTGRSVISSVLLIAALSATLAACGRKGPLEPPPSAVVTDEQGHTKPKPKEDKPIILDKLL